MFHTEEHMRLWERSIPVATFLFIVVGGIWFGGGEWRAMKDKIEWMISENRDMSTELTGIRLRIESIERANEARRNEPSEKPRQTPVFDRGFIR